MRQSVIASFLTRKHPERVRYEEYVYAIPDASGTDCFAVRLFLHSTQIANYEPGTVVAFDKEGLIKTVRDMAGTLVVR